LRISLIDNDIIFDFYNLDCRQVVSIFLGTTDIVASGFWIFSDEPF